MVQTRNQWRQWINNPSPQFRAIPFPSELLSQDSIPDLDWMIPNAQGSDDLCEECSQGETRENTTTGEIILFRNNRRCAIRR